MSTADKLAEALRNITDAFESRMGDYENAEFHDCYNKAREALAAAPAAPAPANMKERWNIERDGDDLLVCFNLHDKGEACEYERFVRAPAVPAPVPLTDEQLGTIWRKHCGGVPGESTFAAMRAAIEASKGGGK